MPELPEVETIKRGLETKIVGLKIVKVEVLNPKSFQGDPESFTGATIVKIWRRAKVLGIDIECHPELVSGSKMPKQIRHDNTKLTLLFHLKMSGQIIYQPAKPTAKLFAGGHPTKDMLEGMPNKSTRVVFEFADGSHLYFNDQRKFGWVKVLDSLQLEAMAFLKNLGPEPLESEFTPELLQKNLARRQKTAIKVAILDQQLVAGIGNIYACEACFLAGLDPRTPVHKLTTNHYSLLYKAIIQSLESSIKYGGSTKQHFYNAAGEQGFFLDVANVYDRKGLPCRICSTPIEKIALGGRGTYFCPKCQKL